MRPDKLLVQTDFDGTMTMKDVMVDLNENYSDESWKEVIDRWERKEITTRDALKEMYPMIKATPEMVRDFIRTKVVIRDGFKEFIEWCEGTGIEVVIVSEGLDFVIDETLEIIGKKIDFVTNHAIFNDPYMGVEFPETPPICEHDDGDICGTCKYAHVKRAKEKGRFVVYIGDGTTDARPAREADLIFARRALAKIFEEEGREFVPFEDFHAVKNRLKLLLRSG